MTSGTRKAALPRCPISDGPSDLDLIFAMAYARIGTICGNLGEGRLAADALRKAFERQSRVSEWERFYISSHYYAFATRELEKENPNI